MRASPLTRTRTRRRAMLGYVTMGATIANWSPPAAANINSVGTALSNAALALQNYLDASGVPPESKADPVVGAFQLAWNADPVAGVAQLQPDQGYGPNTHDALNALTGLAPPVGGGVTPPAPAPGVLPTPGVTPSSSSSSSVPWGDIALVAGGLGLVYLLFFRKKKGGGHRSSHPIIELKSNPRRRKGRRSPSLLA